MKQSIERNLTSSENMIISKTSERDENAVAKPIDGDMALESRNSTVILFSANCDEFFSSIGHAPSTADGKEDSSLHKVSASDHTCSVANVGKTDVINEEEENDEGNEEDMADRIKKNRLSPTAQKEKSKSKAISKISSSHP